MLPKYHNQKNNKLKRFLPSFLQNRRGQYVDLVILVVILFVIAIGLMIIYRFFMNVQGELVSSGNIDVTKQEYIPLESGYNFVKGLDKIFMIAFVMLILSLIISATFIEASPQFFVITLIIFVTVIVIAAAFSNSFDNIITNPTMANESSAFPATKFVFNNFPAVIVAIGIIVGIMFYAKVRISR
ncbi:MAG: hypothetical protein A2W22_06050 [Candidatus Levybacteria bacterium RBG_16_35_11]|nr:MAG: hypothetical protein A2W22_06050 [Candidatus Levybacteria bacterium RBG_16_35_11]